MSFTVECSDLRVGLLSGDFRDSFQLQVVHAALTGTIPTGRSSAWVLLMCTY